MEELRLKGMAAATHLDVMLLVLPDVNSDAANCRPILKIKRLVGQRVMIYLAMFEDGGDLSDQ
jgi:hypothetical protein